MKLTSHEWVQNTVSDRLIDVSSWLFLNGEKSAEKTEAKAKPVDDISRRHTN